MGYDHYVPFSRYMETPDRSDQGVGDALGQGDRRTGTDADSFHVESGGTAPIELRATVRHFYATMNARAQAEIGSRLRYYGHTEGSPGSSG